ncbi:MAG: 50S ribosomal protein L9 [Candidatus Atribacteria bacterium]|nr:50S ribosomal protein L9 [Candidatus Atribacteria bacterium]MCD6349787.1 50S ribosomal protein L9 [Candidatus Atribacteria bacterium]
MRVILLQKVESLGKEGDVVEVKPGYARNFLLPRKLAIESTPANMALIEHLKKQRALREAKEMEEIQALKDRIDGLVLEFVRKAGEKGKLYGSVTSSEIAKKISEVLGVDFDRKFIALEEPIKEVGEKEIKIHLGKGNYAQIKIRVIPEEGEAES